MAVLAFLITAVLLISQTACEDTVQNKISNGLKNLINSNFEQQIASIEKIHKPFLETLKVKGCKSLPKEDEIKFSKPNINFTACINFTETVTNIEKLLLDSYNLQDSFRTDIKDALANATTCLEGRDSVLISICLLDAIDGYGSKIGKHNEHLKNNLIDEIKFRKDIVTNFGECFGIKRANLRTIAKYYARTFCNAEKKNDILL
ncbi:uncharacterized protein LOC142318841 [Lycorma delicatula]|uniref:uncharacterized protein LOC142318841 n=1 Tax=Lycorma delicatula TaxID=130591 RepID=UPI003F51199B